MCQVSHITFHVSHVIRNYFFLQSRKVSQWKACYQHGLPQLIYYLRTGCHKPAIEFGMATQSRGSTSMVSYKYRDGVELEGQSCVF